MATNAHRLLTRVFACLTGNNIRSVLSHQLVVISTQLSSTLRAAVISDQFSLINSHATLDLVWPGLKLLTERFVVYFLCGVHLCSPNWRWLSRSIKRCWRHKSWMEGTKCHRHPSVIFWNKYQLSIYITFYYFSNLFTVQMDSAYSVPESWQSGGQSFTYTVTLPVPITSQVMNQDLANLYPILLS